MEKVKFVDPDTGEYSGRWRAVPENLCVWIAVFDAL